MKKYLLFLFALLTTATVWAQTGQDGVWTYHLTTGGCYITGYTGNWAVTNLTIPKTLNGLDVVGFSSDALTYEDNGGIHYLPLRTITFYEDAKVEDMPNVQQASFQWVDLIDDAGTVVAHGTLPASMTQIGDAFKGSGITTLNMPGVTSIGFSAFEGCNSLTSVTFQKAATIGEYAFSRIGSTCKVTYPGPMDNWSAINVEFSPNLVVEGGTDNEQRWYLGWCGDEFDDRPNVSYYSETSCLYWTIDTDGNMVFDCLPHAMDLDNYLPYQIIKSKSWDKTKVKTLTLSHVYLLGRYEVGGVVVWPQEFQDHMNLTSVVINEGLVQIGAGAFSGDCDAVKSIVLPSSLTYLGSDALRGCRNLEDIYFEGTKTQWDNVEKGNFLSLLYEGVTCTEHWRCAVTFDANGHGTAPVAQTNLWSNEAKVAEPTAPTADGWLFTGWYTDAACTTRWNFGSDVVPGDMTLYAGWAEVLGSGYTLEVPEQVTIAPYAEWTTVTVDVTALQMQMMDNGKTPTFLRLIFNYGTLKNEADNSITIPFKLATMDNNTEMEQSNQNVYEAGQKQFRIHISSSSWNAATPGTYSGTISYKTRWRLDDNTWSDDLESGTIPVTVTVPESNTFAITVPESFENGSVTCDKTEAAEGETVTLTVTPNNGYELESLTVTTADGEPSGAPSLRAPLRANVDLTPGENGIYTFEMPAAPVTINATFKETTVTGVEDINAAQPKSGQRYNMMGQPVGNDYKGIVIQDGRKVIVR